MSAAHWCLTRQNSGRWEFSVGKGRVAEGFPSVDSPHRVKFWLYRCRPHDKPSPLKMSIARKANGKREISYCVAHVIVCIVHVFTVVTPGRGVVSVQGCLKSELNGSYVSFAHSTYYQRGSGKHVLSLAHGVWGFALQQDPNNYDAFILRSAEPGLRDPCLTASWQMQVRTASGVRYVTHPPLQILRVAPTPPGPQAMPHRPAQVVTTDC
jgi:hypothetical protein